MEELVALYAHNGVRGVGLTVKDLISLVFSCKDLCIAADYGIKKVGELMAKMIPFPKSFACSILRSSCRIQCRSLSSKGLSICLESQLKVAKKVCTFLILPIDLIPLQNSFCVSTLQPQRPDQLTCHYSLCSPL